MFTEEQKKKLKNYLLLLQYKTNIIVKVEDIEKVLEKNMTLLNDNKETSKINDDSFDEDDEEYEDNKATFETFQDVYEATYQECLSKFVFSKCCDEINKGKAPTGIGSYFGAAMDYIYDCYSDGKNDPNNDIKAINDEIKTLTNEQHNNLKEDEVISIKFENEKNKLLKDLSENEIDYVNSKLLNPEEIKDSEALDDIVKDLVKFKEDLESLDNSLDAKEKAFNKEKNDKLKLLLNDEKTYVKSKLIEKEYFPLEEQKRLDEIALKLDELVGKYINDDYETKKIDLEIKQEKQDLNNYKNAIKHHLTGEKYEKMVVEAIKENNNKFSTSPRYELIANMMNTKLANNATMAEKEAFTQKKQELDLNMSVIEANFSNMEVEMKHGDLTAESFNGMITLAAESYMILNTCYNNLGFFGKWFTKAGKNYRAEMANIKDPLKEGFNWLVKKNKTLFKDGTLDIKNLNIRDELHKRASIIREIDDKDALKHLAKLQKNFETKTNKVVQNELIKCEEALKELEDSLMDAEKEMNEKENIINTNVDKQKNPELEEDDLFSQFD